MISDTGLSIYTELKRLTIGESREHFTYCKTNPVRLIKKKNIGIYISHGLWFKAIIRYKTDQ